MALLKQADKKPSNQPTHNTSVTTWAHAENSPQLGYIACYTEAPETHPYQLITFIEGQAAEHTSAIASFVSQQILEISPSINSQISH